MARTEDKKFHYIYKTMCIVTNRFYIGMHSTDNLEDGYKGSGSRLWHSIRKHGKENHITEILEFLPSRQELKKREAEIVNEELLGNSMCMNLVLGGNGGLTLEAQEKGSKIGCAKLSKLFAEDEEFKTKHSKALSISMQKAVENGTHRGWNYDRTGRKHTDDAKRKISEKNKLNRFGNLNSAFGNIWISNLETKESKFVKKDLAFEYPLVAGKNAWNKIEKIIELQNRKESKEKLRFEISEAYVAAYLELGDLKSVGAKFGVSLVSAHKRIKYYEKMTGKIIANKQGGFER